MFKMSGRAYIAIAALLSIGLVYACQFSSSNGSVDELEPSIALSSHDSAAYMQQGMQLAKQSFLALSGALKSEISANGAPSAVSFCNVHAAGIVDSLEASNRVSIRRTSVKFRNPANAPDSLEQLALAQFQSTMDAGMEPRGQMAIHRGTVRYFQPIFLADACLQCHGGPDQIAPETRAVLAAKYPSDLAVGYEPGQLRGMWSITFHNPGNLHSDDEP